MYRHKSCGHPRRGGGEPALCLDEPKSAFVLTIHIDQRASGRYVFSMPRPSNRVLSLFDTASPPRRSEPAAAESPPNQAAPKAAAPYSVGQLLREMNVHVAKFHAEKRQARIDVLGEISEPRRSAPGHVYFALKDGEGRLPCIVYASQAARVRFAIEAGLQVVATGRVNLWQPRMEIQLVIDRLEPVGQGALALAFEQRKEKLAKEGYFDEQRKKKIPVVPRRIGIVTSKDAAALRDVLKVLWDRMPGAQVLLSPARVQGNGAAQEIAHALLRIDQQNRCDVILLVRGGGSLEDLWAFNELEVVHALAKMRTPVVTGIGHETDTTLADWVADVRAATPSHAAARAVPDVQALTRRLDALGIRLQSRARGHVQQNRLRLERAATALGDPRLALFPARQKVERHQRRLEVALRSQVDEEQARLERLHDRLLRQSPQRQWAKRQKELEKLMPRLLGAMAAKRELAGRRLALCCAQLEALSPLSVLHRGYSLVLQERDGAPQLVKSVHQITPGDPVRLRFADGEASARILPEPTHENAGSRPIEDVKKER